MPVEVVILDAAGQVGHTVHGGQHPCAAGQQDIHRLLVPRELAAPRRLHNRGILRRQRLGVRVTTQGIEAQAEGGTAARLIDQHRLPALDGRLDFRVPHLQLNLALCRAIAEGRAAVARAAVFIFVRQRSVAGHAVARVQLRLRVHARDAVRGKPVALLERQHRRAGRLVISAVDGHGIAQVAQRLLEAQHRVARRADFQVGVHRRRGGIDLLALRRNRVDGVEDGVRRRIAVAGAGQAVAQLERAHGSDGVRAVLAVHLVRQVAQILQALLNALHVVALHAQRQLALAHAVGL